MTDLTFLFEVLGFLSACALVIGCYIANAGGKGYQSNTEGTIAALLCYIGMIGLSICWFAMLFFGAYIWVIKP